MAGKTSHFSKPWVPLLFDLYLLNLHSVNEVILVFVLTDAFSYTDIFFFVPILISFWDMSALLSKIFRHSFFKILPFFQLASNNSWLPVTKGFSLCQIAKEYPLMAPKHHWQNIFLKASIVFLIFDSFKKWPEYRPGRN